MTGRRFGFDAYPVKHTLRVHNCPYAPLNEWIQLLGGSIVDMDIHYLFRKVPINRIGHSQAATHMAMMSQFNPEVSKAPELRWRVQLSPTSSVQYLWDELKRDVWARTSVPDLTNDLEAECNQILTALLQHLALTEEQKLLLQQREDSPSLLPLI